MSAPCQVCDSPPVKPCRRCQSTLDHRHLAMISRDGQIVAEAVVCVPCIGTFYLHGKAAHGRDGRQRGGVSMMLLAVLVFTLGPQAEPAPQPRVDAAARTAIRPAPVWDRLADCESGGDWSINTGNGFYGGLQFTLSSWRWVGGDGYPHQASRGEQIRRAERLLERQGWSAWPSCARQLGLR